MLCVNLWQRSASVKEINMLCLNLWQRSASVKEQSTCYTLCHRCLYEPVAWYWLGWRESPLAQSVEHWSHKPKDLSSNPSGCNTIFHSCICICDKWRSNVDSVFLCVAKIFLVKLAKVRRYLQSQGWDSSWRGNVSQVFVRTSRLILTRLEGIPFSSIGRALVS